MPLPTFKYTSTQLAYSYKKSNTYDTIELKASKRAYSVFFRLVDNVTEKYVAHKMMLVPGKKQLGIALMKARQLAWDVNR